MANAFSRLHNAIETWSFKYNCYEAVHPWTPYCSSSALEIGIIVFSEAFKLYTPLYMFSQAMQRKYDYDSFRSSAQSILRSTTFISANAFFAILFFCSSQTLTGKFYYYAAASLPGFVASCMAVMIEKPSRRSSLAFYVANVASETLFRIYVGRGYLKAIPNGQVYLFTLAIAIIMWLAKKRGFEDDPLSTAIRLIVGPEEAGRRERKRLRNKQIDTSPSTVEPIKLESISEEEPMQRGQVIARFPQEEESLIKYQIENYEKLAASKTSTELPQPLDPNDAGLANRLKSLYDWMRFVVSAKHRSCPHYQDEQNNCSCFYYAMRASSRALLIGSVAQLGLKILSRIPSLMQPNNQNMSTIRSIFKFDLGLFRMGLFLSTFSGVYKLTNCLLRWSLDSPSKPVNCFISGLVAGPALMIYPSPTVALYVLWKCLEALFHEAVELKIIRHKELFIIVLYGLATNQLFYSALMDPKYMKKSYMAFLHRMSRHKLHLVNRSVLDVFGTEASAGYEDFFPDLHPKFMSRAFLGSIWIWMLEQKYVQAKQMSD